MHDAEARLLIVIRTSAFLFFVCLIGVFAFFNLVGTEYDRSVPITSMDDLHLLEKEKGPLLCPQLQEAVKKLEVGCAFRDSFSTFTSPSFSLASRTLDPRRDHCAG